MIKCKTLRKERREYGTTASSTGRISLYMKISRERKAAASDPLWERHPYTLSFLVTLVILLIYSMIQEIYPFGEYSFLRKDMYHQYLPFLCELRRKLVNGSGFGYSFDLGIGHSFYALYVYYLSDPLNFLTPLIPEEYMLEFMTAAAYIKMSLASSFMCRYLICRSAARSSRMSAMTESAADSADGHVRCTQGMGSVYALMLGVCYGLSGFMASYDWNAMWMWGIALAPLVMTGLEKLIDGGSPVLYTLMMTATVITNYYIAMVVGIFVIVYLIVLCVEKLPGVLGTLRALLLTGVSTVLAAGAAAFLLVPEAFAIGQTSFIEKDFPDSVELYMPFTKLLLRSMMAVEPETGLSHEPGIYASLLTLMLIAAYFLNKRISLRCKAARLFLLGFFYLSFDTNVLEYVWHGLNYPDSLPAREGFLFVLVCLTAAKDASEVICDMPGISVGLSFGFPAVLLIICYIFEREDSHVTGATWVVNTVFILLYAIVGILIMHTGIYGTRIGMYAAGAVLMAELLINFNITSERDISREGYFEHVTSYRALIETAEAEDRINQGHFTRFDAVEENIRNDACLTGYRGDAFFSSTINKEAEDFFREFGMKSSRVHYMATGLTPFSAALLSDGYLIADEFRNNETDYDVAFFTDACDDDYLYRCLYTLPFGYTVPAGYYDLSRDAVSDPIDRQNRVAVRLGGDEVFARTDDEYISEREGCAEFTVPEDGHYYGYTRADIDEIDEYVNGTEDVHGHFDEMKYESIMDLGRLEKGDEVRLKVSDDDTDEVLTLTLYRFRPEAMQHIEDILSAESFTVTEFTDDHIEGITDVSYGRDLVLAMPYDEGWEIEVDGMPYTWTERFYGFLMMLPMEPGVHHISLTYHVPYLLHGIVITCVSLILGAMYVMFYSRSKTHILDI